MAVINVLPSDGKVIDEGPVGCSVDVCCDDFRHLDVGLPPEILRLKDAGYLTQPVAACDRLSEQHPQPSPAACEASGCLCSCGAVSHARDAASFFGVA